MTITADLQPVDQLADQLVDAGGAVLELDAAAGIVAGDLLAAAQPATPQASGALLRTVRATVVAGDVLLVAGGTGVDYAGIVHARQPWLSDTLTRQVDQVVDTYTEALTDAVGRIRG